MKINELVTMVNNDKNGVMNLAKVIMTKHYLPFEEKIELVKRIIDQSSTTENGFIQINGIDQYYNFTVETIKAYTNIEFENGYKDYDTLCAYGILGSIVATFEGEYNMILSLVELEKKRVLEQNNIEVQIAKVANALITAIDQFGTTLSEKVHDLDELVTPENMRMVKEFMEKFK